MIRIAEVDPHDEPALRAFWEVEQAAHRADREHPVLRTWSNLQGLRDPSPYYRHLLLAARDGDRTVGVADLGLSVSDNPDVGELEISVHPDRRREGIGRLLWDDALARLRADGRTTIVSEVFVPHGADSSPAYSFATAMGMTAALGEDHLVLDLPVDAPDEQPADGYSIVTWGAVCPPEHVAAYVGMRNQMEQDVPRGDLVMAPVVFDEERLRVSQERTARHYHAIVAAARRTSDGAFGGYSLLYVPYDDDLALQDDTLVMPEHRGRGLGRAMKLATLQILQREHPDRVAIHTWTAADNTAMQRTNLAFGFRPVERMWECQVTGA